MQPARQAPHQSGSVQALIRFTLRLIILGAFSAFGGQGFGQTFSRLAVMAVMFCILAAALRREVVFGPALTHWDEAAAYAVSGGLASAIA